MAERIFQGKCRYCGVTGPVRYMKVKLDGLQVRYIKTGPWCVDEQACWDRRHNDVPKNQPTLEEMYGS